MHGPPLWVCDAPTNTFAQGMPVACSMSLRASRTTDARTDRLSSPTSATRWSPSEITAAVA